MMTPASRLRVGAVTYLNAKPLYYRLEELAENAELVMDYPSRLADRLAGSELDVALIPSVEYLRGVGLGYEILPGFAITARGPVRSVKLFCRVEPRKIRTVALDVGSRTSQALVRILLARLYGVVSPQIDMLPMGVPIQESMADAVLLIGDRAMTVPDAGFSAVIDLAGAWKDWSGLPFVFALWVVRAGVDLGHLPEQLDASRNLGLAHADVLSREQGPRLGLDFETCYDYLTNVLSYDLGEVEIAGLRRFAREAADLHLAPKGVELVFHRRRDLAASR